MPAEFDVHQSSFADVSHAYDGVFNEDALVDHWWPLNGLDWLNSLPIDASAL